MEILNRKAKHDYFIEEVNEAGIVLTGTEIKSIRNGDCNIKDCYGIIKNGELILLSMPDNILITYILENIIHTVMKN